MHRSVKEKVVKFPVLWEEDADASVPSDNSAIFFRYAAYSEVHEIMPRNRSPSNTGSTSSPEASKAAKNDADSFDTSSR
jgi:hypothetical protein